MKKILFGFFFFAVMIFCGLNFRCSAMVNRDLDMIAALSDFAEKNELNKDEMLRMVADTVTLANEDFEDKFGEGIYNKIIDRAVIEWISQVDLSNFEKTMTSLQKDLSEFVCKYANKNKKAFFETFKNFVTKKIIYPNSDEIDAVVRSMFLYYDQCELFVPDLSTSTKEIKITRFIYKYFLTDEQRIIIMDAFLNGSKDFEMVSFDLTERDLYLLAYCAVAPLEWYTWEKVDFERIGFDVYKSVTENFKVMLQKGIALLEDSKTLIKLPKGNSLVVGDLHGNSYAAQIYVNIATDALKKGHAQSVVFLGDYVDRGFLGVEVIMELLSFKLKFPDKVFLLRGNHETEHTGSGMFAVELVERFNFKDSKEIIQLLYEKFFPRLPLAAEFNFDNGEKALCVHGGIPPVTVTNEAIFCKYRFVNARDRSSFDIQHESSIVSDCLLWSDPRRLTEDQIDRGRGIKFTLEELDKFLSDLKYKFLVRGHEVAYEGLREDFPRKCYTVFSSHMYTGDNFGAMVLVSHLGVERYLIIDDELCGCIAPEVVGMLNTLFKEKKGVSL